MPPDLHGAADIAGNGEFFWMGDRAEDAARWIADNGLAITGGEVYRRHIVGWATYLREWNTEPVRQTAEPWPAYVLRSLEYALVSIEANLGELSPSGAGPADLRFFFACKAENQF